MLVPYRRFLLPTRSAASRRKSTVPRFLLVVLVLPLLSGCGPKRMKADFRGFESAFAETSNREVLLNLARLQNRDPTYFFKLGQITSSYRMQASLTGAGNYVIQGTGSGGNATGGGTPGLLFENDPVFTFIPVSDDTNAQLLLKPVPPEFFYILYQQGWRVDQLMRLMIDRIELSHSINGQCVVQTIRNQPPPLTQGKVSDPESLSDYVIFLRVAAVAYELQKHGYLLLQVTKQFVPFDTKSAIDNPPPATGSEGTGKPSNPSTPNASDIAKAASSDTSWELIDNQWVLGQNVTGAKFVLNPPPPDSATAPKSVTDAIGQELLAGDELNELKQGETLAQTLATLNQGFSIEAAQTPKTAPIGEASPTGQQCEPPHLLMRSLLGLMSAAAQEQAPFDALLKDTEIIPPSRWNTTANSTPSGTFVQEVPKIEQIPTLRIAWTSRDKGRAPLIQVDYAGKQYFIADSGDPPFPEDQYWNRDMFRLISQLQAQVSVDISKFPLPAVLQLNTQ